MRKTVVGPHGGPSGHLSVNSLPAFSREYIQETPDFPVFLAKILIFGQIDPKMNQNEVSNLGNQ